MHRVGIMLLIAGMTLAETPRATVTAGEAVAEALRANLGLLAERANISIAEAQMITARLRPNPVLSAGGDHLDWIGPRFTEDNAAGPTELNLRTDFTLERGGKRAARMAAAGGARLVAEQAYQDAVRKLALETQTGFVETLLASSSLTLAKDNRARMAQIEEVNAARLAAGDISKVEMMRLKLAAQQTRTAERQAQARVRTALQRLAQLLGRTDPGSLQGVAGEFRRDAAVTDAGELRRLALEQRPDLAALRQAVARATAEIRLQQANAKSDVTLGTEYRRQQGVNGKGNSVGLFVEMPLAIWNKNQGEIERARQEQRQAELRLRALEQALAAEAETAWEQFATARDVLGVLEGDVVTQAREVRDITEYSYRRGDATLLELLDAQRAFNETMQAYHEAGAAFAQALYLMDAVSGKAVRP